MDPTAMIRRCILLCLPYQKRHLHLAATRLAFSRGYELAAIHPFARYRVGIAEASYYLYYTTSMTILPLACITLQHHVYLSIIT
jgi:hypothetical protein